MDRREFPPRFLGEPTLAPNPNRRVPLAAVVEFVADRPVSTDLEVSDGDTSWFVSFERNPTRSPSLPVVGLAPNRTYHIRITVTDREGRSAEWPRPLEITTEPLPDDLPPLRVNMTKPEQMEPGLTLFNATRYESPSFGLLVAVDESGEIVWYYRSDRPIGHVTMLRNGNLLYLDLSGATEIDWLGNVLRRWHPDRRIEKPEEGSIPVDIDSIHHDLSELPNGNFLTLSTELRVVEHYPSSEADPSYPPETAKVVGDVIVEFAPDGRVVRQWSMFDLLDPYRIGFDSLGGFWNAHYGPPAGGTRDWTHGNAVFYEPSDDSILVSLRHQDALVMLSRQTGFLLWILGTHDGWNAPWNRYLLAPGSGLVWPYHQHASTVTAEGTILMYDNGNHRARPFQDPLPTDQSYSRVVEYRVDAVSRTVSQEWAFEGNGEERFYSPFGCGAVLLPQTGNVLVADGSRITDSDGKPSPILPGVRRWGRIVEVSRTTPAQKVFEIIVGDDSKAGRFGWSVYRSLRIPRPHTSSRVVSKEQRPR